MGLQSDIARESERDYLFKRFTVVLILTSILTFLVGVLLGLQF